jgi:hypothetical protein
MGTICVSSRKDKSENEDENHVLKDYPSSSTSLSEHQFPTHPNTKARRTKSFEQILNCASNYWAENNKLQFWSKIMPKHV